MKWPFENDSSAIVKKLSRRVLARDRKSAIFLVLTIAAAVAMVLGTSLVSAGLAEEEKDPYRTQAQVSVLAPTEDQLADLRAESAVEWVGEYAALGYSYQGGAELFVIYADADYLTKQAPLAYSGTLPQDADEVMLEQRYLEHEGLDARVGDTVTLDLTGLGETADYRLSAIAESAGNDRNAYSVYVSKALAQKVADETLGGHLQITAYTRLATEDISADGLQSFAENIATPLGIDSRQIYLTDYFAAMNGVLGGGLQISLPLLVFVTGVLAAFIIYSIFYTLITKNVQTLGQLRTIGMTTRQIRRMMRRSGRALAWKGIVLGLMLGLVVGVAVSPGGFRLHTALLYAALSAVFGWGAVMLALWRPVRIAGKTSPIEGTRYLGTAASRRGRTRRRHRPLTPARLARINLRRHPAKTVFTILALAASGALFLTLATVSGSVDAEKEARFGYYPAGDIELNLQSIARSTFDANGEYHYGTRLQLEDNPFSDPALIDALSAIPGVERVTPHDAIYATITIQLPAGDLLGQGNNVPVIDREDLAQMAPLLSNAVDYDAMTAENAVLLSEEYGKAGDSVTLELRGKDGDPYEWQATVAATYDPSKLMENVPIVPGSPTFLLTADSATTLTGVTDLTGVLTIACADGAYDSVRAQVMQLAEASDEFDETDISQTIKNIEEINAATLRNLRLVAVILLLFGGISLANTLIVDLRNRRQELALLGVIGATRRQLVQMLRWELGTLILGAGCVSVVGAGIASMVALARIDAAHHCVTLVLPWTAGVAFLLLTLLIALLCAAYARIQLAQSDMLDVLRTE